MSFIRLGPQDGLYYEHHLPASAAVPLLFSSTP
jgi:hypothetical protein